MNKDAILASIIGFGIGLLITGGVLLGPGFVSQLRTRSAANPSVGDVASAQDTQPTPSPISEQIADFTIDTPHSESIVSGTTLSISGKAPQGSIIMIAGEADETVIDVSTSQQYAGTIALKEGKNDITVSNMVNNKDVVKRITVYVSPEAGS